MNLFTLFQRIPQELWDPAQLKALSCLTIANICTDSRKASEGSLFVALEGSRQDGHRYLQAAIKAGAVALLVNESAVTDGRVKKEELIVPLLAVKDTRETLAWLMSAWFDHPAKGLCMIGITGTNGKTTVANLLCRMLTDAGRRCGIIGTLGCYSPMGRLELPSPDPDANMTTPDPSELYMALARMKADGVDTVVMEVSSHALALHKVAPITFDIGVFTNLTEDHLDFHLNMEGYYAAKEKLFRSSRAAVVNIDDPYGRRIAAHRFCPTYSCSAEGRGAAFAADDIHRRTDRGIEYKISSPSLRMRVRSPLSGDFQIMNTMEASAVASLLGVKPQLLRATLADFSGVSGRLERVKLPQSQAYRAFIDYAHTPDALENTLRTARSLLAPGQRLWVVFGCGGDRDRQKRPIMGNIAASLADAVIVTSDNSRGEDPAQIIKDILSGIEDGAAYTVIENRKEAIEYAVAQAAAGDLILLCGKGHEEYEIDKNGKKPFSEKEILLSAAEKRERREDFD